MAAEPQKWKWKFESRPGGWMIAESEQGQRYRFFVTPHSFHARGVSWVRGQADTATADESEASSGSGEGDLSAQFPGKVRKILVTAGQIVPAGTTLLLMEAMKMEFTVRAPTPGKVAQVLVEEGQQVSPGEKFFEFIVDLANPGNKKNEK